MTWYRGNRKVLVPPLGGLQVYGEGKMSEHLLPSPLGPAHTALGATVLKCKSDPALHSGGSLVPKSLLTSGPGPLVPSALSDPHPAPRCHLAL